MYWSRIRIQNSKNLLLDPDPESAKLHLALTKILMPASGQK